MKKILLFMAVTVLLLVLYCVAGAILYFVDEPLQNLFFQDSSLCRCGTARHSYGPIVDWEGQFFDATILSLCGAVMVARCDWWSNKLFRYAAFWYTIYTVVIIGVKLMDWRFRWVPYTQVYSVEKCICLVIYLAMFGGMVAIARRCRS